MSSSSSTELVAGGLGPGAEVAGFRLERELGRGTRAVVYEAIQVSLGRPVALKLLPEDPLEGRRTLRWPEHPRVVSMFATGPWEEGRFVAMQLVRGPTLARLREAGPLEPARSLELLADVASALDAAHRGGTAHGDVSAGNVFADERGRALLSDFGLAAGEPTADEDRAAFAELVRDCLGESMPPLPDTEPLAPGHLVRLAREALPAARAPRRWRRLAGSAICAILALSAGALLLGPEGEPDSVPAPAQGAEVLGSTLAGGDIESVDCGGRPPSGGSQACTVAQTRLAGRPLVPPEPGAIRRWAVRGARGDLALQVIRRRGDRYVAIARTPYQHVADEGVHVLPANLGVRAGDRVGLQLAPGAAIGVRRRGTGATTARWLGRLTVEPRPVELGPGTGFDHEVLMRAEYVRGARPAPAGRLSGPSARRAPRGQEIGSRTLEVRDRIRRVAVVRLADAIAVDLFAGGRRLARLPVPGARRAGRLQDFRVSGGAYPVLRWRNPGGRDVSLEFAVGVRTLRARG
ncbi:MAG: protein kinase [Thermoleophilaceae bacterium]|nr:protein kinase [Thermoleophilaceae bacterium]